MCLHVRDWELLPILVLLLKMPFLLVCLANPHSSLQTQLGRLFLGSFPWPSSSTSRTDHRLLDVPTDLEPGIVTYSSHLRSLCLEWVSSGHHKVGVRANLLRSGLRARVPSLWSVNFLIAESVVFLSLSPQQIAQYLDTAIRRSMMMSRMDGFSSVASEKGVCISVGCHYR